MGSSLIAIPNFSNSPRFYSIDTRWQSDTSSGASVNYFGTIARCIAGATVSNHASVYIIANSIFQSIGKPIPSIDYDSPKKLRVYFNSGYNNSGVADNCLSTNGYFQFYIGDTNTSGVPTQQGFGFKGTIDPSNQSNTLISILSYDTALHTTPTNISLNFGSIQSDIQNGGVKHCVDFILNGDGTMGVTIDNISFGSINTIPIGRGVPVNPYIRFECNCSTDNVSNEVMFGGISII